MEDWLEDSQAAHFKTPAERCLWPAFFIVFPAVSWYVFLPRHHTKDEKSQRTWMLPELDVFHADRDQFVHPERVTLHHKDFVFVSPAAQTRLKRSSLHNLIPPPVIWLVKRLNLGRFKQHSQLVNSVKNQTLCFCSNLSSNYTLRNQLTSKWI